MFHVHLERMHSAAFGWNILWILLSSLGLIFHLRSMFIDFLSGWLICCFSRLLNSPTIILLLSIYHFMFVNIFFINLSAPCWCLCIYRCYILLLHWHPYCYGLSFLVSCYSLYFKVYVVWMLISQLFFFFSFTFAWAVFFHPFTSSLCIFLALDWVSCRQHMDGYHFSPL